MAYTRVSMKKIREILRLYYERGLSRRQIAFSCKVSTSTVTDYLSRTKAIDISWPIPENLTDSDIEELLYPKSRTVQATNAELPDWQEVSKELQKKHVTRKLLWEEYLERVPDGLGYSRFCGLHRDWVKANKEVSMRIKHKAGEKLFIDYAGQTIPIHTEAGIQEAQVFVATLGASNYSYAEATWSQSLKDWLCSHVRAFKFFGGIPEILVPDNLKSGVTKACYYDPDINESYQELARHYDTAVIPARSRKPKDKAKVETSVKVVSMWVLGRLRNEKFFSLDAANQRIKELLQELNTRPFQKLEGCRQSAFEEIDKPALRPLPDSHYEFAEVKLARVNIDYHVEYRSHYYSVPYKYSKSQVKLRITRNVIEIFHKNERIASHTLNSKKGHHSTIKAHMPKGHREYSDWSPERLSKWAEKVGPSTKELITRVMESRTHPEQGFRSCLGILRLEKTYGAERLEQACLRAINYNACSYKSVKSILKSGFDNSPQKSTPTSKSINHENIRGVKILIH